MILTSSISKEKKNKVVDALNRRVHLMHATTISMHSSNLKIIILDVVVIEQHYLQVKEILQQRNVQQKSKGYEMKEDGLPMHKNIIYVPSSREHRNLVLNKIHNVPYAGHPGYHKIIAVVRSQLFWPGMKKYIAYYISICIECQRVKPKNRHPRGLLQPLAIP